MFYLFMFYLVFLIFLKLFYFSFSYYFLFFLFIFVYLLYCLFYFFLFCLFVWYVVFVPHCARRSFSALQRWVLPYELTPQSAAFSSSHRALHVFVPLSVGRTAGHHQRCRYGSTVHTSLRRCYYYSSVRKHQTNIRTHI